MTSVNTDAQNALMNAARRGNANAVKDALARGASVFYVDAWGNTPMHYAAMSKDVEVCEIIYDAGGNLLKMNKEGDRPISIFPALVGLIPNFPETMEIAFLSVDKPYQGMNSVVHNNESSIRDFHNLVTNKRLLGDELLWISARTSISGLATEVILKMYDFNEIASLSPRFDRIRQTLGTLKYTALRNDWLSRMPFDPRTAPIEKLALVHKDYILSAGNVGGLCDRPAVELVHWYTEQGSKYINKDLGMGDVTQEARCLQTLIKNAPRLGHSVTLWHGYKPYNPRTRFLHRAGEMIPGDKIVFRTFSSTSYEEETAIIFAGERECCLYRLLVPANYPFLVIEGVSQVPREKEVLLPYNVRAHVISKKKEFVHLKSREHEYLKFGDIPDNIKERKEIPMTVITLQLF